MRPPIEDIEKRAAEATKGAWSCWDGWNAAGHYFVRRIGPETGGGLKPSNDGDIAALKADLEFVAHARQDIPALIAYCKELEEALGEAITMPEGK